MQKEPNDPITVGKITTVFGIRGWVKVSPSTEDPEQLMSYQPWWLKQGNKWVRVEADSYRIDAKGVQCHLKGIDDRDEARAYCQKDIWVEKALFPALEETDFYWHQLQGLTVVSVFEDRNDILGTVSHLLETGANDVLVVRPEKENPPGNVESRERLIPYIDEVILDVDLAKQMITVNWDPAF
ncbi:MAG: ribosome maturation factor RimM [bacterium]